MNELAKFFVGLSTDNYSLFDKFQKNKLNYLNEVYDNERTQEVYWGVFQRYIHYHEVNKNKDLYSFSSSEIEDLLLSIPTSSTRTKRAAWTAICKYLDWATNRGYNSTGINPCKDIKIESVLKINRKALAKKVYSKDEIYNIVNTAYRRGSQSQEILAVLLPRYGILGKESSWLINLKWQDVDRESKKIYIRDYEDNIIAVIDIDDRLINWIDKAKLENGYDVVGKAGKDRKITFYDNGYVFKTTRRDSEKINKMIIYGYVSRVCKNSDVEKISLSDLVKSMKFELLDDLKKRKGELDVEDFKYISNLFNPNESYSTYNSLLNDYKVINNILNLS